MKKCIEQDILCIVRLCREHCEAGDAILQMEKKTDIIFELLCMGIFLSMPAKEQNVERTMPEIAQILVEGHVEFCDKDNRLVSIVEYRDDQNERQKSVNCFMWNLFTFTYRLGDKNKAEKNRFLWVSVFLPYIYRLNCFNISIEKEKIKKWLSDYPIEDNTNSLDDNLKIFDKFDELFCNLYRTIEGINGSLPDRTDRDVVLEEGEAGCKVLMNLIREWLETKDQGV